VFKERASSQLFITVKLLIFECQTSLEEKISLPISFKVSYPSDDRIKKLSNECFLDKIQYYYQPIYLREAYGPFFGFIYGWTQLWVAKSGSVATLATGFFYYLANFYPSLEGTL